jgi:hypothetical protein
MKMKSIAALLLSCLAMSLSAPLLADDTSSSGSSDTSQTADDNANGNANTSGAAPDQTGDEGNTQDKAAGDDDY